MTSLIARARRNWLPILILVAHLALGVLYSVVVPLWEAHDEWAHYGYVNYLLTNRTLPKPGERTVSEGEFDQLTQPPLYYLLAALPNFWVNTSDGFEPTPNPYAGTGTGEGGVNMFVHSEMEAFPYRGTALAAHLARLVSVLIGTAAVWFTYLLGGFMFPQRKEIGLGAMAITAFSPQLVFIGSVITNDILVATLSSLVLFLCLRTALGKPGFKEFFLLGFSLGLALLSKYNAWALIPLGLLSGAIGVIKQVRVTRSWKIALGSAFLFLCILGLILWGWVFRSLSLYGTPTTRRVQLVERFLADLRKPLIILRRMHWEIIPKALHYAFMTFWSSFGWGNVEVDQWIYQALAIVCLLAAIGLLVFMFRGYPRSIKWGVVLLLLAISSIVAVPMYGLLRFEQFYLRGRYLLPAISAVNLLLFLGLVQLLPQRFTRYLALVVAGCMFLWALITPFRFISPVYATPPLLSAEELSEVPNLLQANFGDKIGLWGYKLDREETIAGRNIRVTLYWRTLAPMEENYTVSVQVLGPDYEAYGQVDTYPGRGNYATSLWRVGTAFADTYNLRISRKFPAPALGQIKVALYSYPEQEHLAPLGSLGETMGDSLVFGRFKVARREPLQPVIKKPVYFDVGHTFALVGRRMRRSATPGGELLVKLYWRCLQETEKDYTVFLHLVDQEGRVWGQEDSPPRGGYYPTSLWSVDELVEDVHLVPISQEVPEGKYRLLLGFYLRETMERLPVFDEKGRRLLNDEIVVARITVER